MSLCQYVIEELNVNTELVVVSIIKPNTLSVCNAPQKQHKNNVSPNTAPRGIMCLKQVVFLNELHFKLLKNDLFFYSISICSICTNYRLPNKTVNEQKPQ